MRAHATVPEPALDDTLGGICRVGREQRGESSRGKRRANAVMFMNALSLTQFIFIDVLLFVVQKMLYEKLSR